MTGHSRRVRAVGVAFVGLLICGVMAVTVKPGESWGIYVLLFHLFGYIVLSLGIFWEDKK